MSIAFIFTLPARTKQASSLRTLPASVVCSSVPAKPEAFLAEVTLRFSSAKNRCGFRADRLRPPACHSLNPDTAPASRCRAAIIAPTTANSLQRLLQRFIPTPFLRRGVRRVSISFAPKPPLAIPARKDRHLHSVLRSAHCRRPTPSSRP